MLHAAFTSLLASHIARLGAYMVPASRPFFAYIILPAWPGPLPLLSRGAHTNAPHWVRSWASPNKWVTIEKQAHALGKTKDLYSAYCPTGGCAHHPPFCLSLSPARVLHSYVCPSLLRPLQVWRVHIMQVSHSPLYTGITQGRQRLF